VAAKLWAAALAAAVTWLMTVALTLGWLVYTGGARDLPRLWDAAASHFGYLRAGAICVLLVVGPVPVIWRLLVENLWVGLTGRAWVTHTAAILTATIGVQAVYEWTTWKAEPARQQRILDLLPWIAGAAVVLKFLVAGWAIAALLRRGELGRGTAVRLLGAWAVGAAGLFVALAWLVPAELAPRYGSALGAVLSVPLARLAVAPLALAWNRHR
jgi:hypothetical protein